MNELIALQQLLNELIANPNICATAKVNLGFADFAISQAILAQRKERKKLTISEVENDSTI